MSLNVYIGKENLPADKKFIYDVDTFFSGILLRNEPFTERVLQEVEYASYVDGQQFRDQFGRLLPAFYLSTSSKLLLTAARHPDLVLNCSEIGKNAIALFLELSDAELYFGSGFFTFRGSGKCDAVVNGVHCDSVAEVDYRISLYEVDHVC